MDVILRVIGIVKVEHMGNVLNIFNEVSIHVPHKIKSQFQERWSCNNGLCMHVFSAWLSGWLSAIWESSWVLVHSMVTYLGPRDPWKCSLNKSRKIQSASVPLRYILRRNESVASYPALDIQDSPGKRTKQDMISLDRDMKIDRKQVITESRAFHTESHGMTTGRGQDKGRANLRSIIPIPRDATSVATIIGLFPVLNSFKTQSRSFCCLSPWMATKIVSPSSCAKFGAELT